MTPGPIPAFPPRRTRVHEVCGPGAFGFVAVACARLGAPVLWVTEGWARERINPLGFAAFADPHGLLLARAGGQAEALAVAEEALRDGAVPVVVVELSAALSLKAGRRLQLAAQAGGTTGLCIIPEGMGSNAAETRWHCLPILDPGGARGQGADSTPMRWELIKNKTGTLGAWDVRWDHASHRLDVVSPVGERPGAAGAPG